MGGGLFVFVGLFVSISKVFTEKVNAILELFL